MADSEKNVENYYWRPTFANRMVSIEAFLILGNWTMI